MDSRDAALCRDIAIGCAARLDGSARLIRATVQDSLVKKCVIACGHAAADLGTIIDSIIRSFPALALTDAEWARIDEIRGGNGAIKLDANPRARLLLDVGAVEDRVLTIRSMAPEMAHEVSEVLTSLESLAKIIDGAWAEAQRA